MNLPELRIEQDIVLPDNNQWRYRFEIKSETSDRIYIVSQHIQKKHWGCSCMAWRRWRKCKHLEAMGLPNYEKPFEVKFIAE